VAPPDKIKRGAIPVPDRPHTGLVTYEDLDHLITPEERLRVAMARQ